jgi:cysteine desulfurase / selenocysteine lyase
MPPWQGGGNMIAAVTFDRTTYQKPPARFEAGTGNIADAVGLAAALDYVSRIGMANIDRYEHDLLAYATAALKAVPSLRLIGTAQEKASLLSFVLDGYDPVEVGTALNREGIAVRAGHTAPSRFCTVLVSRRRSAPRWPSTILAKKWTR